MANFNEIIDNRCSVRGYSAEKLTANEIKTLVEFGLKAPTARNEQELHFTVLDTDHPLAAEIGAAIGIPAFDKNPKAYLYGAPTFIIISGQDAFPWSAVDAGIAVQNMHLGAASMGLGSVIIGIIAGAMNGEKKEYFAKALNFPEGYSYQVALAVGHPTTSKAPHEFDYDALVSEVK